MLGALVHGQCKTVEKAQTHAMNMDELKMLPQRKIILILHSFRARKNMHVMYFSVSILFIFIASYDGRIGLTHDD